MTEPGIQHKFVNGLKRANPDAEIYRKSGTWKNVHADSGVIVDKKAGNQYIIVTLMEHPNGAEIKLQRVLRQWLMTRWSVPTRI